MIEYEFKPPLKTLIDHLADMGEELQKRGMRSALRVSLKPTKEALESISPKGETGHLKESVIIRTTNKKGLRQLGLDEKAVAAQVGFMKKSAPKEQRGRTDKTIALTQTGKAMMLSIGTNPRKNASGANRGELQSMDLFGKAYKAGMTEQQSIFYAGLDKFITRQTKKFNKNQAKK
ncbi:MAG: hypothetical protein CMI54_02690 [Parcubacteria group bacterium]|nr:hypothetical protein [Parcubacteria group bacterium]